MKRSLVSKWLWFVGLWIASVLALGFVAFTIKLMI